MTEAPFFHAVADAPADPVVRWVEAADSTRLRLAAWSPARPRGTVLLFPGRTEYIEKYGRVARVFTGAGYAVASIDWRGQGLSPRVPDDKRLGHVEDFAEYQVDVAALVDFAEARALPRPWFLVAHSMGGCIGLRALHEGLPVRAAAFSSPMWGIRIEWHKFATAWILGLIAPHIGLGQRLTPDTDIEHIVVTGPFEGNDITTDREMWDYMKAQTDAHPELALGGPTLAWLGAALVEARRLTRMPAPAIPALAHLAGNERIVRPRPIRRLMARWPDGRLHLAEGAEHEIMMERPAIRKAFFDQTLALFDAQS